jgi:peptide/nickel transport system substrate-binding protein
MKRVLLGLATVLLTLAVGYASWAQKPGGTLRIYHSDSPPSMSIHEEVTISTNVPMMGVFNNLVLYDQHVARSSLQSIVPELANSWSWGEDGRVLTFELRQGVRWHDGKPFTAADVKCTSSSRSRRCSPC